MFERVRQKGAAAEPRANVAVPLESSAPEGVQASPLILDERDASVPLILKVDLAYRIEGRFVVCGWCTRDALLELVGGGAPLATRVVSVARPDVERHFSMPPRVRSGFVLIADEVDASAELRWTYKEKTGTCRLHLSEFEFGASRDDALAPLWAMLAANERAGSERWREFVSRIRPTEHASERARGFLEVVLQSDEGLIVVGWVVHTPSCFVWLEDESGEPHSLAEAFFRYRADVYEAVKDRFAEWAGRPGFVAFLPDVKAGNVVQLKALSEEGVHVLAVAREITALSSDPATAARTLLFLGTSYEELHARIPHFDGPLLSALVERAGRHRDQLPVRRYELGTRPESPKVTIIVPLFGRIDFVEHQLLEFSRDRWVRDHAELIYVVDDPALPDQFRLLASKLHTQYRLPFLWVWGSANRGFSGANNLGASFARGKDLLFLNSDVFPREPGWLEALVTVLDEHPEIGAAGPRLLFADGSIQHAGIEFRHREDLGIWVNHHPHMGLDPLLDPHRELTLVPAVTGACLLVRKDDFERVGGWDTGHLIGDFEDTDLCLKLGRAGLRIAYLPTVELTHLERQSFKLLGEDEFRSRVVVYNAVRHQTRWRAELEASRGE